MTAKINQFCQNNVNVKANVTSSGRLFHSFGPADANDHSPTVTRCNRQTVSWLEVDNQSCLRDNR